MTPSQSFFAHWYFHLPNLAMAALTYTLIGRYILCPVSRSGPRNRSRIQQRDQSGSCHRRRDNATHRAGRSPRRICDDLAVRCPDRTFLHLGDDGHPPDVGLRAMQETADDREKLLKRDVLARRDSRPVPAQRHAFLAPVRPGAVFRASHGAELFRSTAAFLFQLPVDITHHTTTGRRTGGDLRARQRLKGKHRHVARHLACRLPSADASGICRSPPFGTVTRLLAAQGCR